MRLIMMGTGPFAVPTFEALDRSPHEVLVLVSRPPRGRRGAASSRAPSNPMREAAEALGVEVWMPESANLADSQARLAEYQADLLVVCDYGEILKPETLAAARLGGVNLHASLLPKYRGAAPINWALYHGEKETGVSVIQMTAGLDAGPCLCQVSTPIEPHETAVELEQRLASLGAEAVCQTVTDLEAGQTQPIVQDRQRATKAPRLKKTDGLIDWSRGAAQICDQVRALKPWPGCYTFLQRADDQQAARGPIRLILGEVGVREEIDAGENLAPGSVFDSDNRLIVATGAGAIEIRTLQPAGKRMLATEAFLRGTSVRPGDLFLSSDSPS